jgi:hypothetical protein
MKIRIDPLDTLFSEYIRCRALKTVGGCERCLQGKTDYKELQCSHFFGRSRKSVRWDPDNAAGLCFGCHQYLGSHPLEHTEWFKVRLGEGAFDMLNHRARTPARLIDKEAIRIYLDTLMKEMR